MGDFFQDLGYEINAAALENFIVYFFEWITKFDVRTINVDYLSQLLTTFSPIWNPIWAAINQFLGEHFGF